MKKTYYLFNPGRLQRKDNTLKFTPFDEDGNEEKPRYLPVENVGDSSRRDAADVSNLLGLQTVPIAELPELRVANAVAHDGTSYLAILRARHDSNSGDEVLVSV